MRHFLIAAALLLTATLIPLSAVEPESTPAFTTPGVPGQGFEAAWLGELWTADGRKLRVFLRLFETDGMMTGSMDSLDENVKNMPVQGALAFGRQLRFELAHPQATFDGQLNADGSELNGRWKQDGNESWLVLRRLTGHPGKR